MSSLLIRQSPLATGARVTSASSEVGLSCARVVAAAANAGALNLRAAGIPTAAQSLDVALHRGGLATGPASPSVTTPGSSIRWRTTGEADTRWRGYIDTPYLTLGRTMAAASGTTDYPCLGQIRQLGNGSLGVVYEQRGVASSSLIFAYKSTRTGTWTQVTVASSIVAGVWPALIVLPSGRLIAYYATTINGQGTVVGQTSTDHGVTWATWTTCRGVSASTGRALRGEVVGDYVALVSSVAPNANKGPAQIYWSVDGGLSFGAAQACSYDVSGSPDTDCSYAATAPGLDGTYLIVVLSQYDTADNRVVAYQIAPGGGFEDAVDTGFEAHPSAGGEVVLGLVARDDGAVYLFAGTDLAYPAEVIEAYVSHTGGLSWVQVGGSVSAGKTVYNNGYIGGATGFGPKCLQLGLWQGYVVGLLLSECSNANDDDSIVETWWGGWDSYSLEHVGTDTYCEVCYLPFDLPHNVGWTRTNVGAGATLSKGSFGTKIVAAGADNSYWDAPTGFTPAEAESRNLTFVGRINSGGGVADNRCFLEVSIDDNPAVNRQWVHFRFSTTQIRVVDTTGTLATISADLTLGFELRIAVKHDEPVAGGGLCSARIRVFGDTHWTAVISNQAIGEAATTGDRLRFGGTAAGAADWEIGMLRCSEDGDNEWQTGGFTNPTDLSGRGVGPLPVYVSGGVSLGGYHGVGVGGDTYTVATTYQYAAKYIWSSKRPSASWRTVGDGSAHTAVCNGGGSLFNVGWVGAIGTNYPTARLQMHTSDTWASPAFEVLLSAIVFNGTATAVGLGFIRMSGARWRPGQFRSRNFGAGLGRRWFVMIGAALACEITDNSATQLYVEGRDFSGFPGADVYIFADRMSARLPQTASFEFLRWQIQSSDTADNSCRTGDLWIGEPLELVDYAHGYSDEASGNVMITDAESGVEILTQAGPARRRKRLAWDAIDDGQTGFLATLRDYLGGIDVTAEPIVLVPDDQVSTEFLLCVADGPLTLENVWGPEANQVARVAQIPFREFL